MTDTSRKRRLAAVLFADMVSYTDLSQRNEALALELVEELRQLVLTSGPAYGGRVIKTMGDGFLLTFDSGLDAARCARSLQQALAERNAKAPQDKRVEIRAGLHLGDVEERDADVFGNGVNLAARVLTVADPGEVCMTQPVFDQLDPESRAVAVDRGTRLLKNMPHPVRIYAIPAGSPPARHRPRRPARTAWIAAVAAFALAAAFGALWLNRVVRSRVSAGSAAKILLAVLPLNNVYHDDKAAPFIEGLVVTLTAELARVARSHTGLQIIPATEVLARKIDSPAEAVKFFRANRVLTGIFQRQGQKVKIVLTLEDSATLKAIDSASREGSMDDVFALQEQLAAASLSLLGVSSPPSAVPRAGRTDNDAAYLAYVIGLGVLERFDDQAKLQSALAQFETAVKLDPGFILAHAGVAETCWRLFDRTGDPEWKDRAGAESAMLVNADLPRVHAVLGLTATKTGKFEQAIAEYQRAADADPASPDARLGLAQAYANSAKYPEAERAFLRAIELNTNYWAGYNSLGSFYLSRGSYAKAEEYYLKAAQVTPDNYLVACNLGGLYFLMGRNAEARKALRHSIELRANAEAYSNLGTLEFAERDYAAASGHFEQAVGLGVNEPTVWGNLADALRFAGKPPTEVTATYDRAIEWTRVRLRINPKDAVRCAQLAYYLAWVDQSAEAVEKAGQARQIGPGDVNVTYTVALAYERTGQRSQALEALRHAAVGGFSSSEILGNPDLAALRQDPGFAAINLLLTSSREKQPTK